MKSTNVLLTGGAGFIGSHLAAQLLARGARLTIIDNLNDFYRPEEKQANLDAVRRTGPYYFACTDLRNASELGEQFKRAQPEIVIHLAAYAGVRPSITNPQLYESVNIAGTVNVLQCCRQFKVAKVIFGSSSSIYGATNHVPFSEDDVTMRPISPYAATKLSGELLAFTYAYLFDMAVTVLRFFTVYGPRQRPDLAIRKFTALIDAEQPIPVFGDGSSARDYTHVNDIVAGVVSTIDYVPPAVGCGRYDVFNLGNSSPVSIEQLLRVLEHALGRKAIRLHLPLQAGDVPITWANIDKAQRLLGYRPATSLEEGIQQFVSWFRSQPQAIQMPRFAEPHTAAAD
jgi:UDP-glucuronate 4-epimerase